MSKINVPEKKTEENQEITPEKNQKSLEVSQVSDCQSVESSLNQISSIHPNEVGTGQIPSSAISSLSKLIAGNVSSYVTVTEDHINLTFSFPKSEFGQMSLAVLQQLEKTGFNNTESKKLKSSEIPKSALTSEDDSSSLREGQTDMSTETLNRSFLSEIAFRSDIDNCEEILSSYMKEKDVNNPEGAETSNNSECQKEGLETNSEKIPGYPCGYLECKDGRVNSEKFDLKTDKASENNKREFLKDTRKIARKIPLDTLATSNSILKTETCRNRAQETTIEHPIVDVLNVPPRNSKSDNRNSQASVDSLIVEAPERRKSLEFKVDPTRSLSIEFDSGMVGCLSSTSAISKEKENISLANMAESLNVFSKDKTKCHASRLEFSVSSSNKTDIETINVDEKDANTTIGEDSRNSDASTACIAENNPELKETITDSTTNHEKFVNAPKSQELNLKTESDGTETLQKSVSNSSEMTATYVQQEHATMTAENAISNDKHLSKEQGFSEGKSAKLEDVWPEIQPFTEIKVIPTEEIESLVSTDIVAKYFQLKLSDRCIVIKAISKDRKEISLEVAEYKKSNSLNMVKCIEDSSKKLDNSEVNAISQTKLCTSAEANDELLPRHETEKQCHALNTDGISNEPLEAATKVDTEQKDASEQVVSRTRSFRASGTDLDTEEYDKVLSESIITSENKCFEVSSEIISDNGHSEINVIDINASQSPKTATSGLYHGPTDKKVSVDMRGEPGSPVKEISKSWKSDLWDLTATDSEREIPENFAEGIVNIEYRAKCIAKQVSPDYSAETVLKVDSKEMLEKYDLNVFKRPVKSVDEVSPHKNSTYDMDVTRRIGSDSEIGSVDETLSSVSDITHAQKFTSPKNTFPLLRGTALRDISKSRSCLENSDAVQSSLEPTTPTVSKNTFREVSHTSTPNIAGKRLQSSGDVSEETSEVESFSLEMSESHPRTRSLSTIISKLQSIVEPSSSVVDKNVTPGEPSYSSISKNQSVDEQSNEDNASAIASNPEDCASAVASNPEDDSLAGPSFPLADCDSSLPTLADENTPAAPMSTVAEHSAPSFSLADENDGPTRPLSPLPDDATSSAAAEDDDAASSAAAEDDDAASSAAAEDDDAASSAAAEDDDAASSAAAEDDDAASSAAADDDDAAASVATEKLKNDNSSFVNTAGKNERRSLSSPLESNDNHRGNEKKIKSSVKGKRAEKKTKNLYDEVDLAPTRDRSKIQATNLLKDSIPENSAVPKCGKITSRSSSSKGKTSPGKRTLRSKSLDPSPTKTPSKSKSSSRDKKLISIFGKTPFAAAENEAVMRIKRTETPSQEDMNPPVRSSPRKAARAAAAAGRSAYLETKETPKQLRSGDESTSVIQSTKSRSNSNATLSFLSTRRSKRGIKE